ncbi:zinc dependent phospholipase C family protein [Paenibacillus sp. FSL R5-0749]|uniref:zinc dependent phospholipase C family protein n=1 Tax=Paenibacillus sp. FSL R5-0749 TaxID=2921657 RepID=UPI00315AF70F
MGSRIMHLLIANRIADSLSIKDKTPFLLGSIAPDAVSSKDSSHFFAGEVQDFSRNVDYKGFIHKYRSQAEDLYVLGYFTHLIADDIWLKGFNLPWLKNRMDADAGLYKLYHNDFRILNGKLLKHYGYTDELRRSLNYISTLPELDEVKSKDVEKFVPYVLGDIEYDNAILNENLNVFTFNQIVGYLETSVDMGILNMRYVKIKYNL